MDHSNVIISVAKEWLKPAGFQQKGRSRFWYLDRGWCATVVEFQPSTWAKGTYLNIATSWFWYPQNHWSYDLDIRRINFEIFQNEEQFQSSVAEMATAALDYTTEYDFHLGTLSRTLAQVKLFRLNDWACLHAGILAALTGQSVEAESLVSGAIEPNATLPWKLERNSFAQNLLLLLDDPARLGAFVEKQVFDCRALLKLKPLSLPQMPQD